ncbi:uncharacterized protein LOC112171633 isoform X2 [Rosa chinensis]|uniref:uncharacterized protein LOC112171633 isoform X2 n=1 Tax=Rosa chinensis TaxID=74649 RepID=UPI001AD8F5E0|nr:uncharacterized protein LOC112171633 isoform X2 [Rosa chinensis]
MDPPPPTLPIPPSTRPPRRLTPKSFVKSLKGKDLRYHVLTSIKRWFQQAPEEDGTYNSSLDKLPPLPDRKPYDLRRHYPVDKEALYRAWDQLAGVRFDEEFIKETVHRLRYKLKRTGYLRQEHGYIFPHPYEYRYIPPRANDFDWMDHESEIEEPAGQDEEGHELRWMPDGSVVCYTDIDEFEISPAEDREQLKLDYNSSDASEISDDPDHGLVPGAWP